MTDERLIQALRRLDRPVDPDPAFAERLYASLRPGAVPRRQRSTLVLVAATAMLAVLLAGTLAIGSGLLKLPDLDRPEVLTDVDVTPVPLAADGERGFGAPQTDVYLREWCPRPAHHANVSSMPDGRNRYTCGLGGAGASAAVYIRADELGPYVVGTEMTIRPARLTAEGRAALDRWLAAHEANYPEAVGWLRGVFAAAESFEDVRNGEKSFVAANGIEVTASVSRAGPSSTSSLIAALDADEPSEPVETEALGVELVVVNQSAMPQLLRLAAADLPLAQKLISPASNPAIVRCAP